ncbi:Hypothetical predicted protein [Olea europaea subsp. europaea]|uniref:Uncharacterized protein n=1 Tax=Olea europaea subsp. europaea TaxID=158383 RepID=A0A8S0VN74_OLEEU|nr:Hypothetical predicted protein [Olea europaea subsp. europaea]
MRQLFAGLTETNQKLQRIEQMMTASQAREQARDDREHARNIRLQVMERDISRLSGDMLTLCRKHDLMGRRLDKCTGRVEDMHIRNDAIYNRLEDMNTKDEGEPSTYNSALIVGLLFGLVTTSSVVKSFA